MVEGMVVAVPTGVKAEAAADASAPKADSPKSVLEDEVIFGSEAVQHF
jgi:ATP-dependent DNA helicase